MKSPILFIGLLAAAAFFSASTSVKAWRERQKSGLAWYEPEVIDMKGTIDVSGGRGE